MEVIDIAKISFRAPKKVGEVSLQTIIGLRRRGEDVLWAAGFLAVSKLALIEDYLRNDSDRYRPVDAPDDSQLDRRDYP